MADVFSVLKVQIELSDEALSGLQALVHAGIAAKGAVAQRIYERDTVGHFHAMRHMGML